MNKLKITRVANETSLTDTDIGESWTFEADHYAIVQYTVFGTAADTASTNIALRGSFDGTDWFDITTFNLVASSKHAGNVNSHQYRYYRWSLVAIDVAGTISNLKIDVAYVLR